MKSTAITVKAAVGTIEIDLSWIDAELRAGEDEPRWAGPVGITFEGRTGVERWNGKTLSDTGADELDERLPWSDLEEAIADELSTWGAPWTPNGELREALSCDAYRSALRAEEEAVAVIAEEESERLAA